VIAAALTVDWPTFTDAVALGAIYALMAVGIGLVFGILRLVNFAYGQLIMAGAFALAITSQHNWPTWSGIVICFAVVLVLSLLMDRLVFRPLRTQSPAVMLVATFAVAFLLENIALLKFGSLGKIAVSPLVRLNQPLPIAGVEIRKITIVAVAATLVILVLLLLVLERTSVGLHMRAASMDFSTARLLGVRANRVLTVTVLISGCLAAVAAIMLTVQSPLVTPGFALDDTIVVLAGVVLGGLNRLVPATLGGFAIGFVSGFLGGALSSNASAYLPSIVFGAVIVVLLLRPGGLFTRHGQQAIERV
jgi:branched-chain amino acid transport system permease protein